MKVVLYTAFALVAFACNSILCRLALKGGEADAAGFTAVRLASGAVALLVIHILASRFAGNGRLSLDTFSKGSWLSAILLFAYAIFFSLAYIDLTASTGALILFGSVQLTMLTIGIIRGERPGIIEWLGIVIAVSGLVYLVLPGLGSPPIGSSLLMAVAGASWGIYSLRGGGSDDPLGDTAGNFILAVPMAAVVVIIGYRGLHLTNFGIGYAVMSGAVTSGIGYAVWYAAVRYLHAATAAVVQLNVPVIAAIIAVAFLAESFTATLGVASLLILGGVVLCILYRRPPIESGSAD